MPLPPVYSTRFNAQQFAGGGASIVTVPDGFIWIVRDITGVIYPNTDPSAQVVVSINGLVSLCSYQTPPHHNRNFHWEGRVVLFATENLNIVALGSLADVEIAVSGYQLTAP